MDSEKTWLAHITDSGRTQTVIEHLKNTGELSAAFAAAFGAEEQGRLIGLAHDIGKCSDEFQNRLRGGRIVDHAAAGALECVKADMSAVWAACCVAGHHSGLPDVGNLNNDTADTPTLFGRIKKAYIGKIPTYYSPFTITAAAAPAYYGSSQFTDSFIIRMLYSCLVDADYLDTERFMSDGGVERGGRDNLDTLLAMLEHHVGRWKSPQNELNRQRCKILQACINGGKSDKGLYTLTVPTGGGKTIASMAFALNHAVKHKMDRVIYVIPYTSIIEQTASVFRDIFGTDNVVEHHSNAAFEIAENGGAEQYNQIRATENWDAPIIVTTAVQFFESLYANRSSKCRKLHNIANSVIIFDEAQMLPTAHLRPCVAAIAELVSHFGATAVLCTATQPVLNDLIEQYAPRTCVAELCPNTNELFSQFRRVTFRNAGGLCADTLAEELSEKHQVLCIVNSRKAAQEVFDKLPEDGSFHLSTLMYPAHRRAVLEEIRQRLKERQTCRVVSTSLIEAGVDVDFPAVYREMAGLDSVLQAAGRCNREGKHTPAESVVTIFEGVSKTPTMLKVNIGAAREALDHNADPALPETVTKYFNVYRQLAGESLDKAGVIEAFENGEAGCMLPFKSVAERFHLIDDASKTVFVPRGKGAELVQRLRDGERSRKLFRELGQYGVSIYDGQYKSLMEAGALSPVDDNSAILTDLDIYVPKTGLKVCDNAGKGWFV